MRRVWLILAVVTVVMLAVTACAPTAQTNVYTNPSLQKGMVTSLAVFPVRNGRLAPGESQDLGRKLMQALTQKDPDVKLVSPTQTSDEINAAGLVDAYSQFVRDYESAGVPDVATLRKIGAALNAGAILEGALTNVEQQHGSFGQYAYTRVDFRLSILSTTNGEVLWEGTGQGTLRASGLSAAPPVYDAVNVALKQLLADLPAL